MFDSIFAAIGLFIAGGFLIVGVMTTAYLSRLGYRQVIRAIDKETGTGTGQQRFLSKIIREEA